MALLERNTKCYKDRAGNVWVIISVKYESTSGDFGDYDEVVQVKKNDIEQGHITLHKDASGNTKSRHERGNVGLPANLEEIDCD